MGRSEIRVAISRITRRLPGVPSGRDPLRIVPIDAVMKIAQDSRGHPPNVTIGERDCVEMADHAVPFPAVALVIDRLHQERQRYLEGVLHLRGVERELEIRLYPRHRRNDAIPEP